MEEPIANSEAIMFSFTLEVQNNHKQQEYQNNKDICKYEWLGYCMHVEDMRKARQPAIACAL